MILRATIGVAFLLASIPVDGAQATPEKNPLMRLSGSIRELTTRVSPAVVEIVVTGYAATDDDSGRLVSQISQQRSGGSGVVVDASGYVVTNAHVVRGGGHVKVLVAAKGSSHLREPLQTRAVDARILGIDRESDLALLKIDAKDLPVLRFGDSDVLRQGDLVFAIGSPLGLRNSLSMGVVSAPARTVKADSPILYIQTDASINPGNSGGALVDAAGFLIGLNSYIVTQSGGNEGIGFAIPSNVVRNVYHQLREKGRVSRGTIDLLVQNITLPMAKGLSLPLESGVVVADVQPEGPSDYAGLKRRDVILSLNRKPIATAQQFEDAVYRRRVGDKLTVVVQRGDNRLSLTAEVKEQSAQWDPLVGLVSPERNLVPRLGIFCIEIDKQVVELMPDLRRQYGLVVAAKSPEGQAQFIDLQQGDVIHAVNNQPAVSVSSFRTAIEEFAHGDSVALQVERDGRFRYVAFEIE